MSTADRGGPADPRRSPDAARLRIGLQRGTRAAIEALREGRWLTRERLRRWGGALALMSLAVLVVHVLTHTTRGLANAAGDQLANDFIIYWGGARAAASGQASLAYDDQWFYAFIQTVTGVGSAPKLYAYPPIAMLLSLPLASLAFAPALIAWTALGAGLCFALLRGLVGVREAAIAVIGAPAAFLDLLGGQNGFFTAALFVGGVKLLERRPVAAGICFGCLAYKPQMGVLLPVALAAACRWRAFAAAAMTVVALVLASVAALGTGAWTGFFDQAGVQRQLLEFDASLWHRMPTVFVSLRVLGASLPFCYAAQAGAAILALVAVAAVWRAPAALGTKAATLAVATFLATPYAWDYDAVVLIFAAAWLGREGMITGFLPWERLAIAALLGLPLAEMTITKLAGVPLGPAVLALALAVLVRRGLATRPTVEGAVPWPATGGGGDVAVIE